MNNLKRIGIELTQNQKPELSFNYFVDSIALGKFLAIRNSYVSLLNDLDSKFSSDLEDVKKTAGDYFPDLSAYLNFLMTDALFESASQLNKRKKATAGEVGLLKIIDTAGRNSQTALKRFISENEGLGFLQALLSSENDLLVACGIDFSSGERRKDVQQELLEASQNPNLSEVVQSLAFGMLSNPYRKILSLHE